MKFTLPVGKITVEFEAEDMEEYMSKAHSIYEVLGEDTCCRCQSNDISPQVRRKGEYIYHELKCGNRECGAVLQFGKDKKTLGLYPRRKEMDGVKPKLDAEGKPIWLPNNGWIKWDHKQQKYI